MKKIKILIPVYNDWQSVSKLIDEINKLSIDPEFQISIIIVNDASNHDRQNEDKNLELPFLYEQANALNTVLLNIKNL